MEVFRKAEPDGTLGIMRFLEKIDVLLGRVGWNQTVLEREADLAENRVSKWRSYGEPTISQGLRIARALGVTLDFLADDSQHEPPAPELLTQDEQVALDFYRMMRGEPSNAAPVLKLLAKLANEGPSIERVDRETFRPGSEPEKRKTR